MENSIYKKADPGINRRDVLKSGLVLAGGALLSAACKTSASAAGAGSNSSNKTVKVSGRRKLGGTLEVSSVGLGVQNMNRSTQLRFLPGLK